MRRDLNMTAFVTFFDLVETCHSRVRIEILLELMEGAKDVTDLARRRELSTALISHHIRAMAAVGLVSFHRVGKHHRYTVNPDAATVSAEGDLELTLRGDDGSGVALRMPRELVESLVRGPARNGTKPASGASSAPRLGTAVEWPSRAGTSAGRGAEGSRPARA